MRHALAAAISAWLSVGCVASAPTPLDPAVGGSVGVPHRGVQTGADELPSSGDGFVAYRPHGAANWGRPRLIRAIARAVAKVRAELPDTPPLVVGDLSARAGGEIPRHRSHRTGRDADLLFYVTTPSGAPVRSPGFIKLQSDGLAKLYATGDFLRLDVPRNWLLVKSLLQDPEIRVQWLFVSRAIEALLIDYARARGEDPELIWRAETVLLQPKDSSPHADHFHMRIACSEAELNAGCVGPPYWQWVPQPPAGDWLDEATLDAITKSDPPPTAGNSTG